VIIWTWIGGRSEEDTITEMLSDACVVASSIGLEESPKHSGGRISDMEEVEEEKQKQGS